MQRSFLLIIAISILILVPFAGMSDYVTHILILVFIFIILSASLGMITGYTGIPTYGHAFPFGIGAYTLAYLTTNFGISPWVALVLGGPIAVAFNLIIAVPSFKVVVKGRYFGMITLAFAEVGRLISIKLWGEEGISYIPVLVSGYVANYYLSLALMLVSVGTMYLIVKSWIGLKFRAIRDDEMAAEAMGISAMRYKLLSYSTSCFFAGMAGSYYAAYTGLANYLNFSMDLSFRVLAMAIVGGLGTIGGPIIGAAVLTLSSEYFRFMGPFRLLLYGLTLVFVLFFLPGGLITLSTSLTTRSKKLIRGL